MPPNTHVHVALKVLNEMILLDLNGKSKKLADRKNHYDEQKFTKRISPCERRQKAARERKRSFLLHLMRLNYTS